MLIWNEKKEIVIKAPVKHEVIEEDWDVELGINDVIHSSSTPQLFPTLVILISSVLIICIPFKHQSNNLQYDCQSGKVEQKVGKAIAKKHLLVQDEEPLVIVKYPKPTLLYTLKEREGHRLFNQDEEFYTWIENLMTKPQSVIKSSKYQNSVNYFRQDIVHIEKVRSS